MTTAASPAVAAPEYVDALRAAYVGELVGATLYRELARRRTDTDERAKLEAIAAVERLTHGRLQAIALRLGIHPAELTKWVWWSLRASSRRSRVRPGRCGYCRRS